VQLTYLEGPASSMFVVVADSLQLAAPCELPGHELQAPPQTFAVEEHKELGHHSGEEKTGV